MLVTRGSEGEACDGRRQGRRYFRNLDDRRVGELRRLHGCLRARPRAFGAPWPRRPPASRRRAFAARALARLRLPRPAGLGLATRFPRRARLRHGRVRYCRPRPPSTPTRSAALELPRVRPYAPLPARARAAMLDLAVTVHRARRHRGRAPRARRSASPSSKAATCSSAPTRAPAACCAARPATSGFARKLGQTLVVHVRDAARAAHRARRPRRGARMLPGRRCASRPAARRASPASVGARARRVRVVVGDVGAATRARARSPPRARCSALPLRQVPDRRTQPPRAATTTLILRPPGAVAADDSEPRARPRACDRARRRARTRSRERARRHDDADRARRHRRRDGRATPGSPSRFSIAPAAPRWAWACSSPSRRGARRSRASSTSRGRRRARAGASSSSARASRSIRAGCR